MQVMNISQRMGELVGITVQWKHDKVELRNTEKKDGIEAKIMELRSSSGGLGQVDQYGGVILCDRKTAHKEARVLQAELSKLLKRPVLVGGNLEEELAIKVIREGDATVVLLMTSEVLADTNAMIEAAAAVELRKLLVPVRIAR